MNTVAKGNLFEGKAYQAIIEALNRGQLGILPSAARVIKKPRYYAADRLDEIEFDLGIEVWPEGAKEFILLFLIECKDYDSAVPVGKITEFIGNIDAVAGKKVKGVFITTGKLQKSARNLAKAKGLMFIEINKDGKADIIFHHARRKRNPLADGPVRQLNSISNYLEDLELSATGDSEKTLPAALARLFKNPSWDQPGEAAEGLCKLSADIIENFAINKINEFDDGLLMRYDAIPVEEYLSFFSEKYGVKIITDKRIPHIGGKELNGYYDRHKKEIHIDADIYNSPRFAFVVMHEIGHFFLHSAVKMDQLVYNGQKDSKYDRLLGKHALVNEKQWIEWQANKFASAFLMPQACLMANLLRFQDKFDIAHNRGHIYVDHQPCNRATYDHLVLLFTGYFQVSQINLEYRLADLGMLSFGNGGKWNRRILGHERQPETVGDILLRMLSGF